MKSKYILPALIFLFLTQQCAKQTAPTGGPKDETAPKLIDSTPANKQTEFKKDKIELTFDEHIQLSNPKEQIIITPSIGKEFEATAKKNKVILEFKRKLKDSTTYNINFRESIQDLNEKNPALVKFAFSTGHYIDSLSIAGSVKEMLTDTQVKNYTVALNEVSDTFNILKHQASWITQTDKEGNFELENLKSGSYFLYAYDDKNKNMIVDSKSEKYGFISKPLTLEKSIDTIQLPVFKLDGSVFKLISAKPIFNYFLIRLTKGIASYDLEPIEKKEKIYSSLETDKTSLKVYNTIPNKGDSLQVRLITYDSTETKIDTLFYLKFSEKQTTKENLQAKVESTQYLETKKTMISTITFSKPIPIINADSIYIQLDSLAKITFQPEDFQWNKELTKLTITKKYTIPNQTTNQSLSSLRTKEKPEETPTKVYNELTIPKGTFISVEIDTVSKLSQAVRTITPKETGVILTQIKTKENFVLQLTNKNNEVIEEVRNISEHKFENIIPGKYQIRLIIDLNKNGKWDPGNIETKTEPEPVIYYRNSKNEKEINLMANWEVGPLLITH